MTDELRDIPGYPDYAITRDGRVWSKSRTDSRGYGFGGHWMGLFKDSYGYSVVKLRTNRKPKIVKIHRLVLSTFVGPCPEGMECRHLDGNPANNNLHNLCWGTGKENQHDRLRHGTKSRGEHHGRHKLTEEDVRVIFHAYHDGYYTQREIAKAFDVTSETVHSITRKKTWSHLWD